ncbi:hypothetical protein HPG69_016665, partial [Diceros bicornis minor]
STPGPGPTGSDKIKEKFCENLPSAGCTADDFQPKMKPSIGNQEVCFDSVGENHTVQLMYLEALTDVRRHIVVLLDVKTPDSKIIQISLSGFLNEKKKSEDKAKREKEEKESRIEKRRDPEAQDHASPDHLPLEDEFPLSGERDRAVILHLIFTGLENFPGGKKIQKRKGQGADSLGHVPNRGPKRVMAKTKRCSSACLSGSSSSSSSNPSRSPRKKPPKKTSSPLGKTKRLSPSASLLRRRYQRSPVKVPRQKLVILQHRTVQLYKKKTSVLSLQRKLQVN